MNKDKLKRTNFKAIQDKNFELNSALLSLIAHLKINQEIVKLTNC